MKTRTVLYFMIFALVFSCSRSRFSTTTRQMVKGKVVYTNHYSKERRNSVRINTSHILTENKEIPKRKSCGLAQRAVTRELFEVDYLSPLEFCVTNEMVNSTVKMITKVNATTEEVMSKGNYESVFRNDPISILRLTRDTTKLNMEKNELSSKKESVKRKTEKLGLAGFILSFFGIIPVLGIPFAILAIIFGTKSLKKIKRAPNRYKGKGFAIASLVIGGVMLVFNIVIIIDSSDWSGPTHGGPSACSENIY